MTEPRKLIERDSVRYKNPGKATRHARFLCYSFEKVILEDDNGEVWVENRNSVIAMPKNNDL